MAFSNIDPRLWDNDFFVALGDLDDGRLAQITYLYLLSGPESSVSCPGLILLSVGSLAEGLRAPAADVHVALERLREVDFVQTDHRRRLIRVPDAPSLKQPGNCNVMTGWFRRWRDVPESPLKYEHIESTRIWCDVSEPYNRRWHDTFGTVEVPPPSSIGAEKGAPVQGSLALERLSKGFQKALPPKSSRVAELKPLERLSKKAMQSGSDSGSGSESESESGSKASRELRLWTLQERLREQIPGMQPLPPPGPTELGRIAGCLADTGADEAQAEHALRVFAADATRDAQKARFFNGTANWSPKAFRFALGGSTSAGKSGAYAPAGRKTFSGTEVINGQ